MLGSSLSLRSRFLIAPFIGILLTIILYFSSNEIINAHTKLFQELNESNLIQISEINHSTAQLAINNTDIIALLLESEHLDEEQIYEQGKDILNRLYQLEQSLLISMENGNNTVDESSNLFEEIKTAFSAYRHENISAIEMASVDPSQALDELVLANNKLKTLNDLFLQLSEYHLVKVSQSANEVEGSLADNVYINEITSVLLLLMVWVAFYFSGNISTALSQVYDALLNLSKGDTAIKIEQHHDKYIKSLWTVVDDFKASLEINEKQKKELLTLKFAIDQHSIVTIADLKGTITYVNGKFCQISGYTKEEVIGENHEIFNSHNQPNAYWKNMYRHVLKGEVWHDEVRNKAKDGSDYWVDITIIPVKSSSEKGRFSGFMSIKTDITTRKEQEKKLIEAKAEAESATVAKSQFIATMSHEIRTPMNGVIGMAQLLKDTPLTNEQKDYLGAITRSGNNLLAIINDILDFSKLDFEAVELENISFCLERVCQECLEVVASNASENNIEYILDYPPTCPRFFMGDPARIRQILINLIGNAKKFTRQGFIRLGVCYQDDDSGNKQLMIEVQDTGIGIKEQAIKHLFNEFSQADNTTTRKYGGTGLGLSITKKLITLMNGEIGINSDYKEGSTFWANIPLAEAQTPIAQLPVNLSGIPILVLDSHIENRRIFKRMLEHMGAQVTLVSEPKEALQTLQQAEESKATYRIMIVDGSLENSGTMALTQSLRDNEQFNQLKLVVFSSAAQKGDAKLYEKAGVNGYLTKLARYETLHAILSVVLKHQQGQAIITQHSIDDVKQFVEKEINYTASVLLVEDIRVNQVIAKKLLSGIGLDVDIADNGQEAVDAVKNKPYDLIFMDCHMPIMDGYEATKIIREIELAQNKVALPIVALTANATREDREVCKKAGMNYVVTKPYQAADLAKCLQKFIPEKQNIKG